jgi:sulfate-transporting ATPase
MAGRTGAVSVAAADSAGSSTSPQSWRPLATRGWRPGPAESPAVLLLDEPAAGLSDTERVEVARLITVMAREWNIAVILIEHDVSLVRRVADRVIALNFGRPVASGPPGDVLGDPAVVEAYLGESEAGQEEPSAGPPAWRAFLTNHITDQERSQ